MSDIKSDKGMNCNVCGSGNIRFICKNPICANHQDQKNLAGFVKCPECGSPVSVKCTNHECLLNNKQVVGGISQKALKS